MSSYRKRIYTKYGDNGETSLLYGGRVPKNSMHCEAYGVTDEVVSAMGLARALSQDEYVKCTLKELQQELFLIGAELATDPKQYEVFHRHFAPVSSDMVVRLEKIIDQMESEVEMPTSFILPGGSAASSAIDMARCLVRTAERRAVDLKGSSMLTNPTIIAYLNRLSDLLFVLARYEDRKLL